MRGITDKVGNFSPAVGRPTKFLLPDEPLSLDELNERVQNGDDSLAQAIYFWAGSLRGSHAYTSRNIEHGELPPLGETTKDGKEGTAANERREGTAANRGVGGAC